MRDVRQVLSVWLSLWFLLLNIVAIPLCHAPSGLSFDGEAVALCHAADGDRRFPSQDDGGPAGGNDHCPLCFVCQSLSGVLPASASALDVPVRIGARPLPGRTVVSSVHLAIGPQQPRAPPALL